MPTVDKHFGPPVFFSTLSSAHTFITGSFDISSAIVTRKEVFGICLICMTEASGESAALKVRTTLNARVRTLTRPLESPRKMDSDPVVREVRSFCRRDGGQQVSMASPR